MIRLFTSGVKSIVLYMLLNKEGAHSFLEHTFIVDYFVLYTRWFSYPVKVIPRRWPWTPSLYLCPSCDLQSPREPPLHCLVNLWCYLCRPTLSREPTLTTWSPWQPRHISPIQLQQVSKFNIMCKLRPLMNKQNIFTIINYC